MLKNASSSSDPGSACSLIGKTLKMSFGIKLHHRRTGSVRLHGRPGGHAHQLNRFLETLIPGSFP